MFTSMNFLSKKQLRLAVQQGMPIIAYSPVMTMPAVTGRVRVEGPWPGTHVPVEEIRGKHGRMKPREIVKPWHADVIVCDMAIVEVC